MRRRRQATAVSVTGISDRIASAGVNKTRVRDGSVGSVVALGTMIAIGTGALKNLLSSVDRLIRVNGETQDNVTYHAFSTVVSSVDGLEYTPFTLAILAMLSSGQRRKRSLSPKPQQTRSPGSSENLSTLRKLL